MHCWMDGEKEGCVYEWMAVWISALIKKMDGWVEGWTRYDTGWKNYIDGQMCVDG